MTRRSKRGRHSAGVDIRGVHLTDKSACIPPRTAHEITRGSIPANESLVPLNHPDIAGKFPAPSRSLAV
ncbi:MAG: hypothetical protein ACKO0N_09060 [Planctomycetota bacterium]